MSKKKWLQILVGGAVWAAAYNIAWGIAWFAYMRREWLQASASIDQPFPWTPEFWTIWIPMTIPFGVAIMAYLASRSKHMTIPKVALAASIALWVPATIGMIVWAWQESLPAPIIVLDSIVNLIALFSASLFGSWLLRVHLNRP